MQEQTNKMEQFNIKLKCYESQLKEQVVKQISNLVEEERKQAEIIRKDKF